MIASSLILGIVQNASRAIDERWLFVFVPLYTALIFILVLGLSSTFSGWSILTRRFRYDGEWTGVRWSWQSAHMRYGTKYDNILVVGADLNGMYLRTVKLMSFRHPPLFIPWNEIQVGPAKTFFYLVQRKRLTLGITEQVPFNTTVSLAEKLKIAAGSNWPVETMA